MIASLFVFFVVYNREMGIVAFVILFFFDFRKHIVLSNVVVLFLCFIQCCSYFLSLIL